ncbi:MAG: endonuclease/exonuclease/phosphatase family protein [Pseudomonadota bacterium]
MATSVFINEIHYDNIGTDVGEGVEIAGPAGTDLTGWNLVFYNGANGRVYDTVDLSSAILVDQDDGFGTFSVGFLTNGIQNGSPDGIALVDNDGVVVQFLSYEGDFQAVDGPAAGLTSTDIGVRETGSTPVGSSLQLTGTGLTAEDFTWQPSAADSFGGVNAGQDFLPGSAFLSVADVTLAEGNVGDQTTFTFEVTRSGDLAGATQVAWALSDLTTNADDFAVPVAGAGVVAFAAGEASAVIQVVVEGDVDVEANETFQITLSNATNGATILDGEAIGTIVNDDPAFAPGDVLINEFRNGGGSNDEFFELSGTPGTSLDGLTLIILSGESDPGRVDRAISLDGYAIQADGLFAFGDVGVPGLDATGTFNPSGAPSTYLLVEGFTGSTGDDLDADDDGMLDQPPWLAALDAVSIVDGDDTVDTNYAGTVIGPDGRFVPSHVFRRPDDGAFVAGVFGDQGNDTPGAANPGAAATLTAIFDIQGASHVSPFVTLDLANLPADTDFVFGADLTTSGIVTAVGANGFYLQDPTGDGDIATSDAIFVRTVEPPGVAVGQEVEVSGTVAEFFPGDTDARNLPTTEIGSPVIEVLSEGNDLPEAVVIGADGRQVPNAEIDDDAFGSFDASDDGIDFFESLEGMLVTATDLVAIAPTTRFGEIFAVSDGGDDATGLSERGTLNIAPDDFNPEKIQIDTDGAISGFSVPQVDAGASLGDVTGVVSYSFGNFEIIPTEALVAVEASTLTPETTTVAGSDNQLTIASYNVLNLDPNDGDGDADVSDGRFDAIARDIVNNMGSPDIIALQEVQDNDGSVNSDVTAADQTLQALIEAIDRVDDNLVNGSLQYEFIDNTFIGDDTSGGQPGGNIRTAFLYNPDRVDLVDGSVQSIQDGDQQNNPDNPFFGSRLPVVATFAFNGEEVTVVNSHFSSKGGSAPILGTEQPFEDRQEDPTVNGSLDERQAQANAVNDFVGDVLADDPFANVVVTGDFNEFEFVSPLETLEGNLTNLVETEVRAGERYSFIFQGNSQQLDHLLISDALQFHAAFDIVHVNTEFSDAASDHDPLVASLFVEDMNEIAGSDGRDFLFGTNDDDMILAFDGKNTVLARGGDDKIAGGDDKDLILAGRGDDEVLGGGAKDRIFGNHGNDKIDGGADDDLLSGGRDDDMFIFNFAPDGGFGHDKILDFGLGDDMIVLKNASAEDQAKVADAIAEGGFGKTVIDFGETGSITVFGFGLSEDDFMFV